MHCSFGFAIFAKVTPISDYSGSVGKAAKAAAEIRDNIVAFLASQGSKARKRGFRSSARQAKKGFVAQDICFAARMMARSAC
jgi:hypothetical protein